jgi:hypothetical protein
MNIECFDVAQDRYWTRNKERQSKKTGGKHGCLLEFIPNNNTGQE